MSNSVAIIITMIRTMPCELSRRPRKLLGDGQIDFLVCVAIFNYDHRWADRQDFKLLADRVTFMHDLQVVIEGDHSFLPPTRKFIVSDCFKWRRRRWSGRNLRSRARRLGNYRRGNASHKLKGITVFVRERPGIERLESIKVDGWIVLDKVVRGMGSGFSFPPV